MLIGFCIYEIVVVIQQFLVNPIVRHSKELQSIKIQIACNVGQKDEGEIFEMSLVGR